METFELTWLGTFVDRVSCSRAEDADRLFLLAAGSHHSAVITLDLFEASLALLHGALDRRLRGEQLEVPWLYTQRKPQTLAAAFVSALDMLRKACERLSALSDTEPLCAAAIARFKGCVPDLVDVRDSIQHTEERILGRNRAGAIHLQPIDDGYIFAPGGALVFGELHDRDYKATIKTGLVGKVRIEATTLRAATDMLQATISAFAWTGPAYSTPVDRR